MAQLTAILDEAFGSQPMAHWHEVLEQAHITFGVVTEPAEVVRDPQLQANDIIVPIEGAGGKLTSTISSPIQVHGVAKVPAKRARKSANTTRRSFSNLGLMRRRSAAFRASGADHGRIGAQRRFAWEKCGSHNQDEPLAI